VLITGIHEPDDAGIVARRILEELSLPFHLDGQEMRISTSIDIAVYPADGRDVDALIKHADAAMYKAKEEGRNNYQFYTESMNAKSLERLMLQNDLRKALERDELIVYYQPQINVSTGAVVGVEALLRWQHPDLGWVPPAQFIPVAEETGVIDAIGEWVLETACRQGKRWLDAGYPPMQIGVNLSGVQLRRGGIEKVVSEVLAATGLKAQYLELELTESMLMQDTEIVVMTLCGLRDRGVHLSVDDFGTGYSSLSYLKRFPLTTLKIDRAFIRDIETDPADAAITKAIIAMAKSLELGVIAEGVETQQQCEFLKDEGCKVVQGYLFSKPVPAGECEQLLRKPKITALL